MRLAYLIPTSGISGGIAIICQHANRLKRRGHDVYLISGMHGDGISWFPNQSVPVVGIRNMPDGLDALIATGWSTSFHAVDLPAKYKYYFVQSDETRFHEKGNVWQHISRLSYLLDFNYYTEARWIKKWLFDTFGHKAGLVPNAVDTELFHPAEPYIPKGNKLRILLEGAIGLPYKGMAEAFEVVNSMDDVEVWCVSSFGRPARNWKVDRFFNQVKLTDMKHIYSSCDILLKLSRVEGFPCPPMEMMACGGMCVVANTKGYDEYIIPEENALVVEPYDIEGARQAIRRIIGDSSLREKLLRNGRETVQRLKWDPSIDRLEEYLMSVINSGANLDERDKKQEINRSISYFYHKLHGVRGGGIEDSFVPPLEGADRIIRRIEKWYLVRSVFNILYGIYRGIKELRFHSL